MTADPRRVLIDGTPMWSLAGRLIPVVAGADPEALFPAVPDDLSTLDRDALTALAAQITERAAITSNPQAEGRAELVGALSLADVIEQTTLALDGRDRIEAHLASLDETEAEQAAALEALGARATATASADQEVEDGEGEDGEDDEDDEDDEGEGEGDEEGDGEAAAAEVVTAAGIDEGRLAQAVAERLAAAISPRRRRTAARTPERHEPRPGSTAPTVAITAAADVQGFASGQSIEDRRTLAQAMQARMKNLGSIVAGGVVKEKVPVATIRTEYPEDRTLGSDGDENAARLRAVLSPQAVTAAGGICAPPQPLYDLDTYAVAERPVRDALPSFNAERGAITYARPQTLPVAVDAVGVWTVEDDELAADPGSGEAPVKEGMRIVCPSPQTVEIEAVYHELTVGNLHARTWPEHVAHFIDLVLANESRIAETRYLDRIKTLSTAVTSAKVAGAWADIVGAVLAARAGMISRHRMSRQQRFRVMLPFWLAEAMPLDALRGGHAETTQAAVQGALEKYGVSVTWYIDGVTGGTGQVFGSQNAGELIGFPTAVQWAFFPEGTFIALDAGTLDLGLVRDSELIEKNDYKLFAEEFSRVAIVGLESYWITSTVCYTGQVQEAGRLLECAAETSLPELVVELGS